MNHIFSDSDIYFEGSNEEQVDLEFETHHCYLTKADVIALGKELGLVLMEVE